MYEQSNTLLTTLVTVLDEELSNIRELTSFENGLQLAQLRQLELMRAQYEYLANPFYADLADGLETPYTFNLENEIH